MRLRKPSLLVVALAAGLFAGSLPAASLNILGVDDLSCSAWSKSKENPEKRNIYVVWMRGVLTGHNYALQGQQVSSISSGTIESYVNGYCGRSPNGLVSDAVFRLSDEFSGRNQPIRK